MANLSFRINGLPELDRTIGIVDSALKDFSPVWQGFIRPVRAKSLARWIVDSNYTLEHSVKAAFKTGGRNVYANTHWPRYDNEPVYERYKKIRGGGDQVLIWKNSKRPLRDTLIHKGNPDHVERVDRKGFVWGTKREYAARLHKGGFEQPWDGVRAPARPIIQLSPRAAFRIAKGAQRVIVDRLNSPAGRLGGIAGRTIRGLRRDP